MKKSEKKRIRENRKKQREERKKKREKDVKDSGVQKPGV